MTTQLFNFIEGHEIEQLIGGDSMKCVLCVYIKKKREEERKKEESAS